MKHPLTGLRVGAVLLFLVGFLSPVMSTGAGAQDLTCDDFTSERAAQAVLDADPDMEDSLDPDGDGIACNHEEDASDGTAADDEEDAAADEEDDTAADDSGSEDTDAYLSDVADTAASWSESLDDLLDIDPIRADVTDAEADDIIAILDVFLAAPDTAADFDAPEGLEDVQDTFEDLADGYADYAQAVIDWSNTDAGSDEEADAEDAAADALDAVQSLNDDLAAAIEDAGGSTADGGSDDESDSTDGNGGEADEYLADAQELVDEWADALDTWNDLDMIENYPDFTDDDWDTVNDAIALWAAAPDDAASFDVPDGYEDVQSALEDLADGYFDIQDLALVWNDTAAGSDEEADAEDDLADAVDAIADLEDDYDTAVEDAGGSSADGSDARDDESDAADDEADATDDESDGGNGGNADVADYLDDVSSHNDDLMAGAARMTGLLTQEDELTDDDISEIGDIIDSWAAAPDEAADLDVPDGMEDVQADYEDVADAFATAADNFNAWLATDSGSDESDDAWADFTDSLIEATSLSAELTETIEDAG